MLDDPLSPSGFIGRQNAIDFVSARLAVNARQSTCLAGGPLTGKTALMKHLASSDTCADLPGLKGACRIFFDGFSVGVSMPPSGFWAGILRGLLNNPKTAAVHDLLDEKLAKAKANQLDLYDLEDVFDAFAETQTPVIIFINNFEILLQSAHFWPPNDFFHLVRSLGQREPRGVAFVISTYRKLLDLWDPNKGASPFYNIIANVSVGLLDDAEIRTFMKNSFQRWGLQLDADVEDAVVEASEGHPYLVNHLAKVCGETLKAQQQIEGQTIEQALEHPAVVTLIQQIRACLTPPEKNLLTTLRNDPAKLTNNQKTYLRDLRSYGLLPPGLKNRL